MWLFDITDLYEKNKICYIKENDYCSFSWPSPKRTFSALDINRGEIELFFHIANKNNDLIFQVDGVSERGFEIFQTKLPISKACFLKYVGLYDGKCAEPFREDIEKNRVFNAFCDKYITDIELSKEQARAILAVDGATLLLAVQGSGKTTVLINRIGHMVLNKGIEPESILAITYTKNAAKEMRQRFSERFGNEIGNRVDFRTINSLCEKIYSDFCIRISKQVRTLIADERERKNILASIYKEFRKADATESEKIELSQFIGYIKNMMLEADQIVELEADYPDLKCIYDAYEKALRNDQLMDYDDQMAFAYWIMKNRPEVLSELRAQYRYICVDEAQDTSKIQHAIIRMLAAGQSIFMVGDEDQSIYGFRSAYPRAMLNFRYDYVNPYILRMERNYRSSSQIVDLAQRFISKNKGRYTKKMISVRGEDENIDLIMCNSRQEQFEKLLTIAKNRFRETALLYRDNESSIVLIDMFLRNSIPFVLKKPDLNFFGIRNVKRIIECIKSEMISLNPVDAIDKAYEKCYPSGDKNRDSRIETLKMLASYAKDTDDFLSGIAAIEHVIKTEFNSKDANPVILSTIHSSKGLEYDSVYLFDIYDGRLPSSKANPFSHSKDASTGEQEDRRLFYVGMTRAINKLSLFYIADRQSSYLDELFPQIRIERKAEERRKAEEAFKLQLAARERERIEKEKRRIEFERKMAIERREAERIAEENIERRMKKDGLKDIELVINRNDVMAIDRFGRRWVRCSVCGRIDYESEFSTYTVNIGTCKRCYRANQSNE